MSSESDTIRLPDECWESIFKFLLINDGEHDGNNHRYLESLSLVSKQLLSITNSLRSSLTITDQTLPFLTRLFTRFTNLTSVDLTRFNGELDALLIHISTFPLNLKSLKFSNQSKIPSNGLRAFSNKITTLTSLTGSNIDSLHNKDLVLISNCFPLLEELDLSNPKTINFGLNVRLIVLRKLRKVNLSGHDYNHMSFLHLFENCEFLDEIIMSKCNLTRLDEIGLAICQRPGLKALSFSKLRLFGINLNDNIFIDSLMSLKGLTCLDLSNSVVFDGLFSAIAENGLPLRKLILQGCFGYTYVGLLNLVSKCDLIQYLDLQNANILNDLCVVELSSFLGDLVFINVGKILSLTSLALFALLSNCAKLNEVRMENTGIGKMSVENSYTLMNFDVYPHLKSLRLAENSWLRDEDINMVASVCPNLQLLDLSSSDNISEEGIGQVLRKCSKIRHLNLACCLGLKLLRINFKISMLEVLNLSASGIDDRSLYMISTSCFGLLQLDLGHCYDVTEKGVMQVIENCTQLREINLQGCHKVCADAVDSMVFMRPSLRKLTAPPFFLCSDSKRKLFLRHGCLVC